MNAPARLGVFGLGLAVVFGAAMGVGRLTGPVGAETKPSAAHGGMEHQGASHGGHESMLSGGLLVSDRGYTLTTVPTATGTFAFRITGPDGRPVTAFDTQHDKRMHLIVVRRDLSGFRHVHPAMDADGTWRVASPLSGPGTYRAFADFKPAGAEPLTLGIDTAVAGDAEPRALPAPATTATVDGYTVTLTGTLVAGRSSRLDLAISRDGRPVTDLQPYLGAYGHLVALRQGDLAYLHVHPDGEPGDGTTRPGPTVTFHAEAPSAGAYRLYLDFQHHGTVHTAEFTAVAKEGR
ncbi:hypothetical protein [Actinoallomurus rhizosphaericola]|uniref:hypothetical protein n=1 Tax=Actinoallomurus rhizosphaericola TaxID=2952536 RepID=UPI0020931350|nr:hypothetical protein [Actinoallomurus rhizosphaericola]MCO5995984.1 hypothetical protein [Actinoallomurus rhizosphaericola]